MGEGDLVFSSPGPSFRLGMKLREEDGSYVLPPPRSWKGARVVKKAEIVG